MSSTVAVCFGGTMFWASDFALGVLFVRAVEVAEELPPDERAPWWGDLVRVLRVDAVMGSSHAVLLDDFGVQERQALLDWIARAASRLEEQGGIAVAEVASWDVLDGLTVPLTGGAHIAAGPLVELSQAMAQLVAGTLPPAPEGRHWWYGRSCGRVLQGGGQ